MELQFTNDVISELQLPVLDTEDFLPIEKRYRTYLWLRNLLLFLLPIVITLVVYFIAGEKFSFSLLLMIIVPTVVLLGLSVWNVFLNFSRKAYLIRQKDISYQRGYFFRSITTIPLNRIQHVEISQPPLLRTFGLYKVIIFTAGGSSSDMSIPGLLLEKAEAIKQHLSRKVSEDIQTETPNASL